MVEERMHPVLKKERTLLEERRYTVSERLYCTVECAHSTGGEVAHSAGTEWCTLQQGISWKINRAVLSNDFNVPDIDWECYSAKGLHELECVHCVQESFPKQFVDGLPVEGITLFLLLRDIALEYRAHRS